MTSDLMLKGKKGSSLLGFLGKLGLFNSLLFLGSCFQGPTPPDPSISRLAPNPSPRIPYSLEIKNKSPRFENGVPEKVIYVFQYIVKNGHNLPGYEGGRTFGNFEKLLPIMDSTGHPIRYQEWDINPHIKGVNRGTQRLITSSDHKAYYTQDHYQTFKEVQIP